MGGELAAARIMHEVSASMKTPILAIIRLAVAMLTLAATQCAQAVTLEYVTYDWIYLSGSESSGMWEIPARDVEQGSGPSWLTPLTFEFATDYSVVAGEPVTGTIRLHDVFGVPSFTLSDDRSLLLPPEGSGFGLQSRIFFDVDEDGLVSWSGGWLLGPYQDVVNAGTGVFLRRGDPIPASIHIPDGGGSLALLVVACVGIFLAQRPLLPRWPAMIAQRWCRQRAGLLPRSGSDSRPGSGPRRS